MILDCHSQTRNPGGFTQQYQRVVRVMKHVGKHHDVEVAFRKRKGTAIKHRDWNRGSGSLKHVKSLDGEIWPEPQDFARESSVSTAHIQQLASAGWKHPVEMPGQHPDAALVDPMAVQLVEQAHRRFIPSRLMRKLESTV